MFHAVLLKKPLGYAGSAFFTFLLDLAMLWTFVDVLGIHYLPAAAISFLIGETANYTINRKWVFHHSKLSFKKGWITFLIIAGIGVIITLLLLAILVEKFGLHYLTSRVAIGFLTFVWNYSMNTHITFQKRKKK
jgi:putative flippase GtrA